MYWNTENYNSVRLEVPNYGISNVTSQYINKQLYCKFTRDASTSIQVPNNPNNTHKVMNFDLNTKAFHILMAIGPVSSALLPEVENNMKFPLQMDYLVLF